MLLMLLLLLLLLLWLLWFVIFFEAVAPISILRRQTRECQLDILGYSPCVRDLQAGPRHLEIRILSARADTASRLPTVAARPLCHG